VEDFSLALRVFSFLAILFGVSTAYLLRDARRSIPGAAGRSGITTGASIASSGVMGVLFSYSFLPADGFFTGMAAAALFFVFSVYYLTGRRPLVLLLISPLLFLIIDAVLPLPTGSIFLVAAATFSFATASVYSRASLAVSREETEKRLGRILWPFLVLERTVKNNFKGPRGRLALFTSYFALGLLILIALPLFIDELIETRLGLGLDILVLLAMVYWLMALGAWKSASEQIGSDHSS